MSSQEGLRNGAGLIFRRVVRKIRSSVDDLEMEGRKPSAKAILTRRYGTIVMDHNRNKH